MRNKNMSIKLVLLIFLMLLCMLISLEIQNYINFGGDLGFLPFMINRELLLNLVVLLTYLLEGIFLFSITKNITRNNSFPPILFLILLILFGILSFVFNYSAILPLVNKFSRKVLVLFPLIGIILGSILTKLLSSRR